VHVQAAVSSLQQLAGGDLQASAFWTSGCGSGLHALAALRLGAREGVALDMDGDSVATTHRLLQAHAAGQHWSVRQASVFDLERILQTRSTSSIRGEYCITP